MIIFKEFILSPANVFWRQKSQKQILICKKGNFLNHELIEKLEANNEEIILADQINPVIQGEFHYCFQQHKTELLVKNKIYWRHRLFHLFSQEMASASFTQFELSILTWQVFSKITAERAKSLAQIDMELFLRAMSIATSQTLGAFMLGYYNEDFLSRQFDETFLNFMQIHFDESLKKTKEHLEKIRCKVELDKEDIELLEKTYNLKANSAWIISENFDGSGPKGIKAAEMTDLEKLLLMLNAHYAFKQDERPSFFHDVQSSLVNGDKKIILQLKKCLLIGASEKATPEVSA